MRTRWTIVLVACAACGGGGDTAPDARDIDAEVPPDADSPDADLHGTVTITVTEGGDPLADVDIVFSEPDGSVLSHVQTDADGVASEIVLPGSAVTIARSPSANVYDTYSFLAITPGDQLAYDFAVPPEPPTKVGEVTITMQPVGPNGSTSYRVSIGCADTTMGDPPNDAVIFDITTACAGTSPSTVDALAVATDGAGAVTGWDFAKGVEFPEGVGAVDLDGWQSDTANLAVSLVGVPDDVTSASLSVLWMVGGIAFDGIDANSGPPTGGAITLGAPMPAGFVDKLRYSVELVPAAGDVVHTIHVQHGAVPLTPAHNVAQLLMPEVRNVSAAASSGQLVVSWTAEGSFDDVDGALVHSSWIDGAAQHTWRALAPAAASSPLTLPALPEALSAYRTTDAATFSTPSIALAASSTMDARAFRTGAGFDVYHGLEALPSSASVMRVSIGGALP